METIVRQFSSDSGIAGGILRISLSAIIENYAAIRTHIAPAQCAAVLKADAYGLGAADIAPALYRAGCRLFFVALLNEALQLRPLLPSDADIFVLNGLAPGTERTCLESGITPVLNSYDQTVAWAQLAADARRRLPAVLQFDTGMSRMGLSPEELARALTTEGLLARFNLAIAMSHLAAADVPDHPANCKQREAFEAVVANIPARFRSLANSAGIFLGRDYHYDLCRPGAALYGLQVSPRSLPLRRAVEVYARVAQTRSITAGDFVGYGWTFQAAMDMRLATISVGYADGWPRSLGNSGAVWFEGNPLAIVGRVSMDSFMVDISHLPEGALVPGSYVELLGPHQAPETVGSDSGTIGYEMFTRLGRRFHRDLVA